MLCLGYAWEELNREDGQKRGGGLAILYKQERTVSVWKGLQHKEGSRERIWLNYNSGTEKYGLLFVYMACQSYRRPDFMEDNVALLNVIAQEIQYLRSIGFKIVCCGDMNAWTGTKGKYGISGNRELLNKNGELLVDFMIS